MSTETLFPKTLDLVREDGKAPITITVSQIALKHYDAALKAVNAENEFALVAIACGTSEAAVKNLSPESYELLLGTVYQLNEKGFFTYARRRKTSSTERAMIHEMAAQVMAQPAPGQTSEPSSQAWRRKQT